MNRKSILFAAAALTLSAQEPPPPPHFGIATAGQPGLVIASEGAVADYHTAGTEAKFVSFEMSINAKAVTGAPYAADAVTETKQTLGDGNTITRKTSSKTYRDSQGRTRRELSFQTIGPWSTNAEPSTMVQISDPVAGVNYSLNSTNKQATKIELPPASMHEQMAANLKKKIAEAKASGAAVSYTTESKHAKEESLGSQMVNGVQADGSRTTITIPAGEIGNQNPIDIVDERWYSTDLQTLVKSVHSDPRMGTTTYELTNIDRAEPAASLFEVPADYKVTTLEKGTLPMAGEKLMMERIQIHKNQE